jgi:hypothetical protein
MGKLTTVNSCSLLFLDLVEEHHIAAHITRLHHYSSSTFSSSSPFSRFRRGLRFSSALSRVIAFRLTFGFGYKILRVDALRTQPLLIL